MFKFVLYLSSFLLALIIATNGSFASTDSPTLPVTDDCYICDLLESHDLSFTYNDNVTACDDLYAFVCVDNKGELVVEQERKAKMVSIHNKVEQIQYAAVQNFSYSDTIFEYLNEELKKESLLPFEDLTIKEKRELLSGTIPQIRSLEYNYCSKLNDQIDEFYFDESDPTKKLLSHFSRVKAFNSSQTTVLKHRYQKHLDLFVEDVVGKCEELKAAHHPIPKLCKNPFAFKKTAFELLYAENSEKTVRSQLSFINKYFPILLLASPSSEVEQTSVSPENKNYSLIRNIEKLEHQNSGFCDKMGTLDEKLGKITIEKALKKISTNKEVMANLIEAFYDEETQGTLEQMKSQSTDVITKLLLDSSEPSLSTPIFEHANKLSMGFPMLPDDSKFEYDEEFGHEVLKLSEVNNTDREILNKFFDPNLTNFKFFNSFYYPVGKRSLYLLPAFSSFLKDNPLATLFVLAHEVGHHFDYTRMKEIPLNNFYDELLQCYQNNPYMHIKEIQYDEIAADFLATEVLVRLLKKVKDKQQRKKYLLAAARGACSISSNGIRHENTHPDTYQRMNGIMGSHPEVRKILGCKKPQKMFNSCHYQSSPDADSKTVLTSE